MERSSTTRRCTEKFIDRAGLPRMPSIEQIDRQHAARDAERLLANLTRPQIKQWLTDRKEGRSAEAKRDWLPSCGVAIPAQPEYTEMVRESLNQQIKRGTNAG